MSTFRNTKLYDLAAASPLIVFNAFAIAGVLILLTRSLGGHFTPHGPAEILNLLSFGGVMAFLLLQTVFLVIRKLPQQFSQSLLSQAVALTASNGGFVLLLLPHVALSPTVQIVSSLLILTGASASALVMIWLGKGFSILPQARQLTMHGPYRFVRHPLYLCETITTLGLMLQYRQPWSILLALLVTAIQFPRMMYEERVLESVYPDYRLYASRTALFLPKIL